MRVIYGKIKLHGIRLKMQEQGLISKDLNIIWLTFFSVFFWLIPVLRFKSLKDIKHNKEAKTVNASLLGMLVVSIAFMFTGNIMIH